MKSAKKQETKSQMNSSLCQEKRIRPEKLPSVGHCHGGPPTHMKF